MWIEETPSGKYKYCERYEDPKTGKIKKVSLTHAKKTKKVQEDMLIKLNEKIKKKLDGNSPSVNVLFSYIISEWLEMKKEEVKPSTYEHLKSMGNALIRSFEDLPFDKLDAPMINHYYFTRLNNKEVHYSSLKNMDSMIKNCIKYAYKYHGINKMDLIPLIEIPKMNMTKKNAFKYLEKDELHALLKNLRNSGKNEFARMAEIQASTGMRYGEMVSLRSKDIDFDDHSVLVSRNYDRTNKIFTTTKTSKSRTVYFNDRVAELFKEQINRSKMIKMRYGLPRENDLIFVTKHGNPVSMNYFNIILKKNSPPNKPVTSHYFRHTFITLALEAEVDKNLIAEQVGHEGTEMIDQIYAHFTKEMEAKQKKAMLNLKII